MDKGLDFTDATWIKSVRSWDENCVEVAFVSGGVGVRDSKNTDGPILSFTDAEWDAFAAGVKDGEIRRPLA
ncbi:DUF397 domain-containing protein [Actinoplanes sp. TRM 88003]|uniref:DUF397 domain-containing protein n=1 Tax=Paractinoplanes aksuensis TaxID=2939490 RepID=A0ABT1DLG6_9ACTN|nr:DUF397 domain-containing protein [Actinoplanes aksuensis]MCO8271649.1 DUF397 domain-containing protein [Actinoplanes aksuensis]